MPFARHDQALQSRENPRAESQGIWEDAGMNPDCNGARNANAISAEHAACPGGGRGASATALYLASVIAVTLSGARGSYDGIKGS